MEKSEFRTIKFNFTYTCKPEFLSPSLDVTVSTASDLPEEESQVSGEGKESQQIDKDDTFTVLSLPKVPANRKCQLWKQQNQAKKLNFKIKLDAHGNSSKSISNTADQDELFLRSLLPVIRKLKSRQKVEFRREVEQLLERIGYSTSKDTFESHRSHSYVSSKRKSKDNLSFFGAELEFYNSKISAFQKDQVQLIGCNRSHVSESDDSAVLSHSNAFAPYTSFEKTSFSSSVTSSPLSTKSSASSTKSSTSSSELSESKNTSSPSCSSLSLSADTP